jgi:hypothetical protein
MPSGFSRCDPTLAEEVATRALHVASPDIILSRSNLFNIAHFAVGIFNFDARQCAR